MEAIVFIILQIFFATRAVLKIILGYPPVLAGDIRSRDVFRPIARERKDLMDYNLSYSGHAQNHLQNEENLKIKVY